MEERVKTLNDVDIEYINQTYSYIEKLLVELNKIVSGYHCKFETGYGWRQNLAKLNDLEVISNDLYKLIYNWCDTIYTIGQVVPLTEWEWYCGNASLIKKELRNLVNKISAK
ncbi:hypothetical protein DER53_03090 [Parageobacillus toebii NBRC 107807]|uniref:Uncharacterized protein n=1 Tax=Parageobacillus toebii NBRC 107807 TaxID=1223503 RepID=A0A6G9J006_9BACL|nr:hypothetical protein [Parageobacillus toebii]MBB3870180.1 hypothetical protein [Parageobacillus toebii NBRC 107807]MED4968228.1 hypothetical protein [Parageobacillus toebii]QIQ31966.1 hypothetical protein DER53_03090 [Parageobacillus toebii NBRC 107807]